MENFRVVQATGEAIPNPSLAASLLYGQLGKLLRCRQLEVTLTQGSQVIKEQNLQEQQTQCLFGTMLQNCFKTFMQETQPNQIIQQRSLRGPRDSSGSSHGVSGQSQWQLSPTTARVLQLRAILCIRLLDYIPFEKWVSSAKIQQIRDSFFRFSNLYIPNISSPCVYILHQLDFFKQNLYFIFA